MNKIDSGPVEIQKGKIVGRRWKVVGKLGEGGCGAVYKVLDITSNPKCPEMAALKAESNFVSGGGIIKQEVQVIRRLSGRPYVVQLLHSGIKERYSYMVMTLMGENLSCLIKKIGKVSISTQTRIAINVLYGIKQIHEVGFIHRDLKPANIAVGHQNSGKHHFLHVLDFGLSREYVVKGDGGRYTLRKPRLTALFRGTLRYCSINTHEKQEQGRMDDLWSLMYMLAEMRNPLPWRSSSDKKEVLEIKKQTSLLTVFRDSPSEYLLICHYLKTLDYFKRPDYFKIYTLLNDLMKKGKFKYSDPYEWEQGTKKETFKEDDAPLYPESQSVQTLGTAVSSVNLPPHLQNFNVTENPFPIEEFQSNLLGL